MTAVARNRGGWTKAALEYLDHVQLVFEELEDYWPLTLRQVYYRLVTKLLIENEDGQYKKLSRILTKARLDGKVPWHALEDRARQLLGSGGWDDSKEFVDYEIEDFLTGYRRDLLQGQTVIPELWVEKDALSRICHPIARKYCVDVVVAKGFSSVSYLHDAANRIRQRWQDSEQETVILYFGDLDPSGWEMLPAMMTTLKDEMWVDFVTEKRCALTPEQVDEYNLSHSPKALNPDDSRAKKYVERFGKLAVELDAFTPMELEDIVERSIRSVIDTNLYTEQRIEQERERKKIKGMRDDMMAMIEQRYEEGL